MTNNGERDEESETLLQTEPFNIENEDSPTINNSSLYTFESDAISCNVCKISFTVKASLVRHLRTKHNSDLNTISKIKERPGITNKVTDCHNESLSGNNKE